MTKTTIKLGNELEVGDVIELWGPGTVYRITAIEPYTGTLASLYPNGVWTAHLAGSYLQAVTVDADSIWTVYA